MSEQTSGQGDPKRFTLNVLLAFIVIFLILVLMSQCHGDFKPHVHGEVAEGVEAQEGGHHEATEEHEAPAEKVKGGSVKLELPGDVEIDAMSGGIEDKFVAFLHTDYKSLGEDSLKNVWFDFDNLNFATGSNEISPESQKQIDNIAAILKAYPDVKIKIGGYTDKTGSEPSNKQLSAARAQAVKAMLEKAGVGAQVTGAEGYGSEFAKYPADAPEGEKAKDRHISISVRS